MNYYFAPLEGITDSIYRRLHHTYFPGVHRYYTPFFSPTVHRCLTPKESRELPPAEQVGFPVIPQILTKVPEDFIWMAQQCRDLGYSQVNLNLGCPSGTVTAKGKGSGMLRDLQELDRFLDAIFSAEVMPISVKTRIGFTDPGEFPALMEVYNRYPICELTVHPRVRSVFYKGPVDINAFEYCLQTSKNPVCYNGNVTNTAMVQQLETRYPQLSGIMIGRGLIGDPGMLSPNGNDPKVLEAFYSELLETYIENFGGSRNAMFRLKEHWSMLIHKFDDNEKLAKQLRKTTDIDQFRSITAQIFHTLPMRQQLPDHIW